MSEELEGIQNPVRFFFHTSTSLTYVSYEKIENSFYLYMKIIFCRQNQYSLLGCIFILLPLFHGKIVECNTLISLSLEDLGPSIDLCNVFINISQLLMELEEMLKVFVQF